MNDYTITYYFGGTITDTIQANSLAEAKQIAEIEMKPILDVILNGKYQVDRSWY
jgi:hypothetical protein